MARDLRQRGGLDWLTIAMLLLPERSWPWLERRLCRATEPHGIKTIKLPNGTFLCAPDLFPGSIRLATYTHAATGYADDYGASALLREGETIIDAGAYLGGFSLFASRCVGQDGRVVAVEPVASTSRALQAMCALNGLTNVTVLTKALGNTTGYVDMAMVPEHPDQTIVVSAAHEQVQASSVRVELTTIDTVVGELGLERVDWIKLDVEGFEREVLLGAHDTLRRFRPGLLVSAYHRSDDLVALPQVIRDANAGYRCEVGKALTWGELVITARVDRDPVIDENESSSKAAR